MKGFYKALNGKNKITKIGIFYLAANIFEKAVSFFLLPVFTNLLPTKDYGIVSTYMSYESIIAVFICLSLGNSLRGAVVDFKESLDKYTSSVLILETAIAVCISIIIVGLGTIIMPSEYKLLVIICPIHAFFASVISMLTLRYMLGTRYVLRTFLSVSPALFSIFVSLFFINRMQEKLYMGRILGLFVVIILFGLVCYLVILIQGKFEFKIEYCKYAVRFSAPLVFHGLSLIILNQMDRVMITRLYNAEETGIYSVAYSFGTIAAAFTAAMNDVWVPWFNNKMEDKNNLELVNLYGEGFVWTCVLLSCGVMLLSPEVMKWLTNDRYWEGINVVPMLVIGNFFSAICGLPINAMYYTKKTKMIATSSVVAMMMNLLFNILFIPRTGAFGAAVATVISYFVLFFMQNMSVLRYYDGLFCWKIYILPFVSIFAVMYVSYIGLNYPLFRWLLATGLVFIYIFYAIKKWDVKGKR